MQKCDLRLVTDVVEFTVSYLGSGSRNQDGESSFALDQLAMISTSIGGDPLE